MAGITVHSTLDGFSDDLEGLPRKAHTEMVGVVREGLRVGNSVGRDNARRTAGSHGKYYPRAFSWEMHGALSSLSGGDLVSGEYGPDAAMPQGGMEFEDGSRNQPAHLDVAKSYYTIAPAFRGEASQIPDRLFW